MSTGTDTELACAGPDAPAPGPPPPRRSIIVPTTEDGLAAEVLRAVDANPELFSTAVHEAGHVVMGWTVGANLAEATIVPREEWVPSVVGLLRFESTAGHVTFKPLDASGAGLLANAVLTRGGLMAEMVGVGPSRFDYGRAVRLARGDLRNKNDGLEEHLRHLIYLAKCANPFDGVDCHLFRDAEDLLRAAVGKALQKLRVPLLQVAVALVTHKTLDGEELKQLRGACAKAWQSSHPGEGSQDPFDGSELLKNLALELHQLVAEYRAATPAILRDYEDPRDHGGAVEDEPLDDAETDEEPEWAPGCW